PSLSIRPLHVSSLIRRAPRPTLLPYTTLFRSVYARGSVAGSPTLEVRVAGARAQVLATDKGASVDIPRFNMRASGLAGVDATAQDRKSTRLNSSHVKISYAVFCLKKKSMKSTA